MREELTILMTNLGFFYVFYGVDGSKYKNHINMVEPIKGLQECIYFYKVDNEMLMKDQEKQGDFNVNLMKSFERIEKKICKETESS
jgi:hypothetical protein